MGVRLAAEEGGKEAAGGPLHRQRGKEEENLGQLPFHQPDQLHQCGGGDAQERTKSGTQVELRIEKSGVGCVDQNGGGQKPQSRLKSKKHQSAAGGTQKAKKTRWY